jgi:hypothetical protein
MGCILTNGSAGVVCLSALREFEPKSVTQGAFLCGRVAAGFLLIKKM